MPVIEVQGLHKRYGNHVVVQDVSFAVERGEIFAIIGPNGAGKTTTVESIAGLRRPDAGHVRVLGLDPQKERDRLRPRLGIQLQASQLPDKIKVWEALDLYGSFYDRPAGRDELLAALGLSDKRDAAFDKLSGGQKQRLSIALALIGRPEVLILDELTTGLDPQARRGIWGLIEDVRARGVTILLVTHFMEEAERLSDRVAMFDAGRVVALDTPAGVVARIRSEQRLRFRPSAPLDERLLAGLPEVHSLTQAGPTVVVTGTGNLVQAVTSVLARNQIVANELRIEQASLDDAFIALTGHKFDTPTTGGA